MSVGSSEYEALSWGEAWCQELEIFHNPWPHTPSPSISCRAPLTGSSAMAISNATPSGRTQSWHRSPWSICARLIQSCRVWGTADLRGNRLDHGPQRRILVTMLLHQAHRAFADFGENLFGLFMAPSSQSCEPPQNPGRFTYGVTAVAARSIPASKGRAGFPPLRIARSPLVFEQSCLPPDRK